MVLAVGRWLFDFVFPLVDSRIDRRFVFFPIVVFFFSNRRRGWRTTLSQRSHWRRRRRGKRQRYTTFLPPLMENVHVVMVVSFIHEYFLG